jgi:hypothetical protein
MGAWDPKQKFKELTVNYFTFLQLRVGSSDVLMSYFIVSNFTGGHGYYCGYRFIESSPSAVAHFLEAVDMDDEALLTAKPGARAYADNLPYSAKMLAEGGGSAKFHLSVPTAVDGLQGSGKMGFVVGKQAGSFHNVYWRVHLDPHAKARKAEELKLSMFVQNFPANIPAAVHPAPGFYYTETPVFNDYSQAWAVIDPQIQRQLGGPPRWHLFDLSRFFPARVEGPPAVN